MIFPKQFKGPPVGEKEMSKLTKPIFAGFEHLFLSVLYLRTYKYLE